MKNAVYQSGMPSGIIVLARMTSTRLPGKVMLPLCGVPVIEHMVRRLRPVPVDRGIVVATTAKPSDDILGDLCSRIGVHCFRGDEDNVLERCIQAAERFGIKAVVRLGGDSPLCDSDVVGGVLHAFLAEWARGRKLDYASNTLDRRLPVGLDVEVYHIETLRRIAEAAERMEEKERRLNQLNVAPFVHAHPEVFDMLQVGEGPDLSEFRLTLDTPEDLELITRIYETLFPVKPCFGLADTLELLHRNPEWPKINAGVVPVSGFWTPREREKFERRYSRAFQPAGGDA